MVPRILFRPFLVRETVPSMMPVMALEIGYHEVALEILRSLLATLVESSVAPSMMMPFPAPLEIRTLLPLLPVARLSNRVVLCMRLVT